MTENNTIVGSQDHRIDEEMQLLPRQLESLWTIARMTDASHPELCDLVLAEIEKLTDSQYAFIGFLNEDESEFLFQAWSKTATVHCAVTDGPIHLSIQSAGQWRRAVVERQPFIVNDFHLSQTHKKGLPDGHVALKRFLTVPIVKKDNLAALVAVANKAADYTHEDVLQIQTFVSNILPVVEKRRSEEMLKEREQLYRSALETAHSGIILQDASGEILTWNKGAQEIFGVTSEEALGHTAESRDWAIIREDGSKYDPQEYPNMRTLRTGEPHRNDMMGKYQPDGTLCWLTVDTTPLFHANETTPYAVATSFSDITDLKKERDLSQTYLDIAGVMLMALSANGDILSINKKGCQILEASEEALLGKNWFKTCLPESSVERGLEVFGELMAGRIAPVEYDESSVLTLTGKEKIIAWHNTVMRDSWGEITGTFSSGEDITTRKAAETALRRERDMTRLVMETSPVGIVHLNARGQIVYANPQAASINGAYMSDIAGRFYNDPVWKAIDMEGRPLPEEKQPFWIVQKAGRPVFDIRHGLERPDGRKVLLSINATPLFDDDGGFNGMVAAVDDITATYEAEQKYQMLFREMLNGFSLHEIICDDQGKPVNYRFLDVNPAFERLTGLQREKLIGRTVLEVLPKTPSYIIEAFGGVALRGEPVVFESFAWEIGRHFHVAAFRSAQNQFACVFADITERVESEEALKQSEASLRLAQEIANVGNWVYEVKTGRVHWSDQLFRMFGFEPGVFEPTIESTRQRIHPDDAAYEMAATKAVLESPEGIYEIVNRVVRADGAIRIFYVKGIVYERDEDGNPLLLVGISQDITERKLAEQALQKSSEQHRSVLETAMDGYWMADNSGRFLEINRTYCRMSGYSEQELLSMTIADVEAAETADQVLAQMEMLAVKGEDRFESRHRRKDGTIYDVEVSVQYRADDGGRFICFIRDITEHKKMERRLAQAQRMESIGNLAGGIAHDFNNILFPIVGLAELLIDDLPAGSPERQSIKEILKAGMRGGDLVKQILAFSRQSENRKVPVRFQNILQEVLKLVRSTIPANIDINQDIQEECGLIMADPTQLHQIVMNLITNAYHAVEDMNGRIDVQFNKVVLEGSDPLETSLNAGCYARLTVTDTGCGILPELMGKIFEPYFTTKEQGKGTGLGLAVVFGIVREHGGEIKVYSEPGSGTTFTIYLPLIEDSAEEKGRPLAEQLSQGSEHILIVDDESAIVELEKTLIERLGYRVTERFSSTDALEAFKAAPDAFDLVITDMTMPNMTGDRLAKTLIDIRPDIPVIICTGFSEKINRDRAEAIGVKGFLMKPIVWSELALTIRKVLDESK